MVPVSTLAVRSGHNEHMVQKLIEQVVAWAASNAGVEAVVLVGSHARGEARPDSDVDLVLLTTRSQELLDDPEWAQRFGNVQSTAREDWGRVQSLRVIYESGLEVEFGLALPDWATAPDAGTIEVVEQGLRVLWDPQGLFGKRFG